MASTFKNYGLDVGVLDDSTGNMYTAGGSVQAVVHALYISNKSDTNAAKVNVKVTTDGGSTFFHVGRSLNVNANNTLVLEKEEIEFDSTAFDFFIQLNASDSEVDLILNKQLNK